MVLSVDIVSFIYEQHNVSCNLCKDFLGYDKKKTLCILYIRNKAEKVPRKLINSMQCF